jgi:cytochrome bd-type quinol oxidase subunit 2
MFNKLTSRNKRSILLAVTALVVAYVRSFIQYHRYSWESLEQFLISWLIHYFAVLVLIAISYVFIITKASFFLGREKEGKEITAEEATVYVSFVLLVLAILVFFVAHWPASDDYE